MQLIVKLTEFLPYPYVDRSWKRDMEKGETEESNKRMNDIAVIYCCCCCCR